MIRILYPTDFSASADKALKYLVPLAQDLGASIDLIHIYKVPPLQGDADFINLENILENIREGAEDQLHSLAKNLPEGLVRKTMAIFGMFIPQEIVCYAENNGIDLIAMGAKGAHNIMEHMLGSVTTHTMLKSSIPVLSIPEKAEYKKVRRIAYATDLNPKSFLPVLTLNKIATRLKAELRIVHVEKGSTLPDLNQNKKHTLVDVGDFPMDIIINPSVEKGLNEYIKTMEVDWLSMFIPRRRLWERVFHHSLSQQMFFHTHIPLLVYRE